jgi:hypothetical protein
MTEAVKNSTKERNMKRNRTMIMVLTAGLAGPATMARAQSSDERTQTEHMPGGGMTKEREIHKVATIQSIDKDARTVTVVDDQGKTMTVSVPKTVKSFDKLKPGQLVNLGYFESLAVSMHKPGEPKDTGSTSQGTSTMPAGEGQGPGRVGVRQTSVTVEVVAVDPKNHTITVRAPDGETRTVNVQDPALQQKLSSVHPSDNIDLTYTEAVAASLVPMAKKK